MTRATRALVAVTIAAALAAPVAVAEPDQTWNLPEVVEYQGGQLPAAAARARGLECNAFAETVTCYDDLEVARGMAALAGGGVVAMSTCSPGLTLWWDGPFSGSTITIYTYPGWTNLSTTWRNEASSWATGCRSGKLADFVNGGGSQISLGANQSQGSMPSGWNDRADSVYRG